MDFARVIVPAAPVRKKPNHRREMVNQLLFGEAVQILKERGSLWVKVKSLHDDYTGWMTHTLLKEVSKEEAQTPVAFVSQEMHTEVQIQDKRMIIPAGSSLPLFKDGAGAIGDCAFSLKAAVRARKDDSDYGSLIRELALAWLNAPYLWGGRTIYGVDCSGFVQVNFKMMGMDLPRDAWQQAQEGNAVKKLKDAQPGDLAFFDDKDEIVHVGILLNSEEIIHASGKVRIDPIDKKGITNSDSGKRTHQLKAIRRLF